MEGPRGISSSRCGSSPSDGDTRIFPPRPHTFFFPCGAVRARCRACALRAQHAPSDVPSARLSISTIQNRWCHEAEPGSPTRVARRERGEGARAHRPLVQNCTSDVPTRGRGHHGSTTQRESASRCVSVRACALPNNISSAASPALSPFLSPDIQHASHHPLLSSPSLSLALFLSLSLYLTLSPVFSMYSLLHVCLRTSLSLSLAHPR